MFAKHIAIALLVTLISTPVFAKDYVVHVHGIVCSFCAKGVTKKISKLPFIDQTRFNKGVKVEIEEQKVTIAVLAERLLDLDSLFRAIQAGGYEPHDVWIVGDDGELTQYEP